MRCYPQWFFVVLTGLMLASRPATGAEPAGRQQDEQAIRHAAQEYLAALESGDAKALSAAWTADGDFVDELGRSYPARELIEHEAKLERKGPRPATKVVANTIRFLTPDVAIEDGRTEVTHSAAQEATPLNGRFTAIWVRQEGKWRLASLREARLEIVPDAGDLADLDWLVGDWTATGRDAAIDISAHWNETHTFLLRELSVIRDGKVAFSATQRIGRDPLTGKIRSWLFDSDGGYGEGLWTKKGKSWVVQATGALPDGKRTLSTNVFAPAGPDGISWKTSGARVGDEPRPDLDLKLTRKPASK